MLRLRSHGPPPPLSRGRIILPRSRGAPLRPSYVHATVRKPFEPPLKEGRRSAKRRTTGFRPAAERKACLRCGARYIRPCPALARDLKSGALAFRRATAVMRRGSYPSTRFRAALPGITGSKRENPLRHQCSQHLAVRSRAGRSMPRTARICSVSLHLREPLSFHFRKYPRERPLRERDGDDVINTGTDVKSQSQHWRLSLLTPSWRDLFRPSPSLARSAAKTWMPAT